MKPDFPGYIKSMMICLIIGLPFWFLTRNSRSLKSKDGFAIVSIAWLIVAFAGSLPFYLSGVIPNITDAWFESMSGVTTTGATIIGNPNTLPNLPNGIESMPHGILFWRSFSSMDWWYGYHCIYHCNFTFVGGWRGFNFLRQRFPDL